MAENTDHVGLKDYLEVFHREIKALEKRLDDLREADRMAVQVAYQDMRDRLHGFPQQFATKDEMQNAIDSVTRLERDSLSREIYDSRHKVLEDRVTVIVQDKLPSSTFQTFVDNYQREREEAAVERRTVAIALATSSARETGQAATWKQIGAVIAGIATLLGILTLVINYFVGG